MITRFSSGMSPPDTSGKLGGASFLLSGAAAFSSETSSACEPPPLGSKAPVSASSPVLIGANSISLVLHDVHDVSVHPGVVVAARFDIAPDLQRCEGDDPKCQDRDHRQFIIKHRGVSGFELDAENTA